MDRLKGKELPVYHMYDTEHNENNRHLRTCHPIVCPAEQLQLSFLPFSQLSSVFFMVSWYLACEIHCCDIVTPDAFYCVVLKWVMWQKNKTKGCGVWKQSKSNFLSDGTKHAWSDDCVRILLRHYKARRFDKTQNICIVLSLWLYSGNFDQK